MTAKPSTAKPSTALRLEFGVLVTIVLLVGVMAGAASFTHVHDWTMHNSPAGTGDWFGWANAVITELIPIASLIVIARRRINGHRIGYPVFLLVVAVGLSLTAQLAVARPTVFGWMVSALPALAFFALSKLVFTQTRPTTQVPAPVPATVPAQSTQDAAPATVRPPAAKKTTATTKTPAKKTTPSKRTPAKKTTPAPAPDPQPDPAPAAAVTAARPAADSPGLLPGARIIADAHRDATGETITPGQLAVRLRVATPVAERILTQLSTIDRPATTEPHNGTPIRTGVPA